MFPWLSYLLNPNDILQCIPKFFRVYAEALQELYNFLQITKNILLLRITTVLKEEFKRLGTEGDHLHQKDFKQRGGLHIHTK